MQQQKFLRHTPTFTTNLTKMMVPSNFSYSGTRMLIPGISENLYLLRGRNLMGSLFLESQPAGFPMVVCSLIIQVRFPTLSTQRLFFFRFKQNYYDLGILSLLICEVFKFVFHEENCYLHFKIFILHFKFSIFKKKNTLLRNVK